MLEKKQKQRDNEAAKQTNLAWHVRKLPKSVVCFFHTEHD